MIKRNNGTICMLLALILAWINIIPSNWELTLVHSEDIIKMVDANGTEVISEEIAGFKNYPYFGKNNTVNGKSWYYTGNVITETTIKENWLDQGALSDHWVLIIPFDNSHFLENLNLIDQNLQNIHGVIFTYSGNPQITNPAPSGNTYPEVISFGKLETLKQSNIESYSYPNNVNYKITHQHNYYQYWDVMSPAFKYYVAVLWFWGFITISHIFWTWCIKKDYSTHLQKIILFVPIFFTSYTLIDYVYFLSCPWTATSGVQYLQIVQIALVTIFNTLFVGLCWFVSQGWSIMRSSFTRQELSSITMIVGIFYLVYSAYFIASDIPSLKIVIIIILIIMYIFVTITCIKNSFQNIKILRSHIALTGRDEITMEALKLKRYMMFCFVIISTVFYINKIIYSCLYTFIEDNKIWRNLIVANLFIELTIISAFLFLFRSRKWPEYFSLDLMYRQLGLQEDQEALPKSVIMNAVVPSNWVTDNKGTDMVLSGWETNYYKIRDYIEPQIAMLLDTSEQDPYKLSHMTHQDFRSNIYSDIKFAIEERCESSDSD